MVIVVAQCNLGEQKNLHILTLLFLKSHILTFKSIFKNLYQDYDNVSSGTF